MNIKTNQKKNDELSKKKKESSFRFSRMSFYIFNLSIADITVAFLSILPQIFELDDTFFLSNSMIACKAVKYLQVKKNVEFFKWIYINRLFSFERKF